MRSKRNRTFDPDNKLIFVPGGLNSTGAVGASKSYLTSKSPYQYPCHSFHCTEASNLGPQIKRAGYDALIIEGKAHKPVYLHIYNGKVEILDAQEYWGQNAQQRNALLENMAAPGRVSCTVWQGKILLFRPESSTPVPLSLPEADSGRFLVPKI